MWLIPKKHFYIFFHFIFTSLYSFFSFILKPVIILKSDYEVYHLSETFYIPPTENIVSILRIIEIQDT